MHTKSQLTLKIILSLTRLFIFFLSPLILLFSLRICKRDLLVNILKTLVALIYKMILFFTIKIISKWRKKLIKSFLWHISAVDYWFDLSRNRLAPEIVCKYQGIFWRLRIIHTWSLQANLKKIHSFKHIVHFVVIEYGYNNNFII